MTSWPANLAAPTKATRLATPAWLTPPLFAALAIESLAMCVLLGGLAVERASRTGEAGATPDSLPALAQLVLLLAAAATSAWLLPGVMRRGGRTHAMLLAATLVVYGLAALGVKGAEWASWQPPQVVRVEPPPVPVAEAADASAAAAPVTAAGDAAAGAKAFRATALPATAAAEGVPQVGPALRGAFLAGASDPEVAAIILDGRPANDPTSKMGKAMPANGGNPFLTEADVQNIIAFLRGDGAGGGAGEIAPAADPAAALPRWVVPAAGLPAEDLVQAAPAAEPLPPLPPEVSSTLQSESQDGPATWRLLLSALHGLHLLVAAAVVAAVLALAYLDPAQPRALALAQFARFYWAAAAAMWLVLMPLLY